MNIGLYISASQNASYHDAVEQVILGDRLGYSSVWLTEKHFEQGNLLWSSPLIAASYLAAKTQRIKIGFAACVSTLHHPVRLAEDFANLDVLSNGRIIIGLTRTSLSEYYHDVFQSPLKKSWRKFDEQFAIMLKLWQGRMTAYSGSFYKIPDVKLYPSVVQQPLPPIIFIAASDDSIIDAARKGVGIFLHAFQSIEAIKAKKRLYEENFNDTLGLGPRIILSRFVFVSEDQQALTNFQPVFMRFIAEQLPKISAALEQEHKTKIDFNFFANQLGIFGDANHCQAQLKNIAAETGIIDYTLIFNLITLSHQQSLNSMQRFALNVLPKLNFQADPLLLPTDNND